MLGFWALTAFGVGDILGAGIYALVGQVAARAGTAAWGAFFVTLVIATLTALSYAELGSRFPKSGGEAHYCQQAFGWPALSLLIGYLVLASGVVSMATVSHAFAGYFREVMPVAVPEWLLIPSFLGTLALVAMWGIRQSSTVNVVLTIVEASGLMIIIVAGCHFLTGGQVEVGRNPAMDWTWGGILQGSAIAFFAFIGFEDMVNVAEEVERPDRNIPLAMMTALGVAAVIYMAVAWIATAVVPVDLLTQSQAPLMEVIRIAAPGIPPGLFSSVAVVAVTNTALLNLIMGSRILFGMADQGLLPRSLRVLHPVRKTPQRTIAIVVSVSLALALAGSLVELAGATNLLLLTVFFFVNVSLVIVRINNGQRPSGFRIPIVVSILGALSCPVFLFFLPLRSLVTGGCLILLGIVLITASTWTGRLTRSSD